mmetsp:Transcript_32272/g.79948  ORF Transcript_32272/g.79948 Transcript_32272/m.79948 type:complete len:351 (+) Transcript_32272:698-1750(+)
MERALGLIDDHLVAAAHEDRHRLRVGAILNDDHAVLGRAERLLVHVARRAELVCGELREARHDARVGRNGEQLDLDAAHPADRRQVVLHQQVVRLVVKTPLADDEVAARVLDLFDHVEEVVLLRLLHLLVRLHRLELELVLRLRLRRLEGAREDAHLGILDVLGHLRVRHVLVDDDAAHEARVLQLAAHLAVHLDEVEVDILAIEVSDSEHGIDGDLRHGAVRAVDNLRAQRRHRHLHQRLAVLVLKGVCDRAEVLDSDRSGAVKALGDTHRVDAAVEESLCLVEQRAREHNDARRAVANLVVLRLGQLDEELADLVVDAHLLQDGGTIVRDGHIAVGALEHLVHALGPQ